MPIQINGKSISNVDETKFLGVYIDSRLSWSSHLMHLKSKICKGIGIINRAKRYLTTSTLLSLYNCFVYPYFSYCIEIWGSAADVHLKQIVKLQKRVVRIINCSRSSEPSTPIFQKFKLLRINEIYTYNIGIFMYKHAHHIHPEVIDSMFIKNNKIHMYNTRQSKCLHKPKVKLSISQRTIKYKGVTIWNNLSSKFNTNVAINIFKSSLKSYCLSMLNV